MSTYGYIRVSTAEQVKGTSLDEQKRKIAGVALMRGDVVTRIFEEPGISGSISLEARPAGSELAAVLRSGDVLIVAKLDRAFRNAADALTRADAWKKMGVSLIVADMGVEPVTENGVSKMFFGILALMAEFERERVLERTADGRKAKRAQGGHTGGSAPFGFTVEGSGKEAKLIEDAGEQFAIGIIRAMRARKFSLRHITSHLNERGFTLSREAVRRIAK